PVAKRERRPCAVLLRPVMGAEGAVLVRRSFFVAPNPLFSRPDVPSAGESDAKDRLRVWDGVQFLGQRTSTGCGNGVHLLEMRQDAQAAASQCADTSDSVADECCGFRPAGGTRALKTPKVAVPESANSRHVRSGHPAVALRWRTS